MKFSEAKKAIFRPGFRYPPDQDGKRRAQNVTRTYPHISSSKNLFFGFQANIPNIEKDKSEILALKKFNEKFHFSYE